MLKIGFDGLWVNLIMMCVCNIKYTALVNNKMVGHIHLGRRLRQGYSLSPYLFIICTYDLSPLIEKLVVSGELEGVSFVVVLLVFLTSCLSTIAFFF